MKSPTTVITLGGSILVPDSVNTEYLTSFVNLITSKTQRDERFFIIVGGGKLSREYQNTLRSLGEEDSEVLDWIGIYATHLNARLVQNVFGDTACSEIFVDPTVDICPAASVVVGGGWKPGWSTDYVAVEKAITVGAERVLNISNIDCVYSADPKIDPSARPLNALSWKAYLDLIPDSWTPGLKTPFDPVASKRAQEKGIEVSILGPDLQNLESYLDGNSFTGTVIS